MTNTLISDSMKKIAPRGMFMKRISLEKIEKQYHINSYRNLYQKVMELMDEGRVKPVKASGINGKKPALYNEYWEIEEAKDTSALIEELSYWFVPTISTDYYLHHLKEYQEDRPWILLLNQYLKTEREELKTPQSMNERSFAIWRREKFLKEEQGKKILKRCGIPLEMLNIYETTEPLAYYVHTRETPQNMLIVENKDTFYSMRKHLLSGKDEIFGKKIGTLIYGAGKGIYRSFEDFTHCAEPYMREKENKIYYFGDMDYEGILIYEKFVQLFGQHGTISPFGEGYTHMNHKARKIGLENLPFMKEGQNQNISSEFWNFFGQQETEWMQTLLQEGRYIPQEILSEQDF